LLAFASTAIAFFEFLETEWADSSAEIQERLKLGRQNLFNQFRGIIEVLEDIKGEGDDISD
jgi:hypothetical protein